MIGNASAFRINSDQGLSYFNRSSNQSQFNVSPDGVLDAKQIGTKKNPITEFYSRSINTNKEKISEKVLRVYTNNTDISYRDRLLSEQGDDIIDALRNLKNEFGNDLKKVELPSGTFNIDPENNGTLKWDISADIIGQGGARSANRGGAAATAIVCRSDYSGALIKGTVEDISIKGIYFSMNRNGGDVLEFDQGDFAVVQDCGAAQIGNSFIYIHNGSHRCTVRHCYCRGAGLNGSGRQEAIRVERTDNNVRQTLIDTVIISECNGDGIRLHGVAPVDIRNAFLIGNALSGIGIFGAGAVSMRACKFEANQIDTEALKNSRSAELRVESSPDFGNPGWVSVRDCHFNLSKAKYYIEAGNQGSTLQGMLIEGNTFGSPPGLKGRSILPSGSISDDGLHILSNNQGYSGEQLCRATKNNIHNVHDGSDGDIPTVSLGGSDGNLILPRNGTKDVRVYVDAGGAAAGVEGIFNIEGPGVKVTVIHTGGESVTLKHNYSGTNNPLLNQSGTDDVLGSNGEMATYVWDGTAWRQTGLNAQ